MSPAEHNRPEGLGQGYYCNICGAAGLSVLGSMEHGIGRCQPNPDLVAELTRLNDRTPPVLIVPKMTREQEVALTKALREHQGHIVVVPKSELTFERFHNALRIMRSIDLHELQAVGVFVGASYTQWYDAVPGVGRDQFQLWDDFRSAPSQFFIRCEDEIARKIWGVVESRQGQT